MILGCCGSLWTAHAQDRPYSISVLGTYTTSSKLFHHPNDPDELLRSEFLPLDDIFSFGLDARKSFDAIRLQVGVSLEYLRRTDLFDLPTGNTTLTVRDGFAVYPLEVTGYFLIPVGSDQVRFYMGGGGGMYIGERIYEYNAVAAKPTEHPPGFGIHIVSGIEYFLNPVVSLRGELKFRDVQFETTNRFPPNAVLSDPNFALVGGTQPFQSRINIDGMTMNIGLAFHL